jgi:hypothetical protein
MSTDATVRAPNGAASRITDTLLRVVGGQQVQLRILTTPAQADAGQVGLPGPLYQDYALAPAVFRRIIPTLADGQPDRYELLISATAVTNLLGTVSAASPQALFAGAVGVVANGTVMAIEAIGASEAFGAPYLYTLTLRDQ